MRLTPYLALSLAAIPACVAEDDTIDLGAVSDGKSDTPELRDVAVSIPKLSSAGKPGVRNFSVRSSVDFEVSLTYAAANQAKIVVTNLDTGAKFESSVGAQPKLSVIGTGSEQGFKIRVENHTASTLKAKLSAIGKPGLPPELVAAARANLSRIAKEVDVTHLQTYGLTGSTTEQFMTALSDEYETQHPDQYAARIRALGSMIFFALPDVLPPASGLKTPFHGLDSDQFGTLMSIEDQIFNALVAQNSSSTVGVRPFSVCETTFIIESYVRPKQPFPGFSQHKTDYTTASAACTQKDKDDWYNFRGLGGLRPSWVESNLSDRFLRRMVKTCKPGSTATDCAAWNADRFAYRQLRNRQLAARTMYYAPADEAYLINPDNALVFLEDRDGDNVGEFLRPGPVTLTDGQTGTLQVNSTGQFSGNLKFVNSAGVVKTVTPNKIVAESSVHPDWHKDLLLDADMGLLGIFADSTGCTGATIDQTKCPLMQRFYSMIDRHENFYRTYSALSADFFGVSSQPSPLVACSITLAAAHVWDTAGTPAGGTAGFIFLMRVPFKDILTGNDTSVATVMPGPKTTSIQSLYAGQAHLDMSSLWLDVASLSNNQYQGEHEISAFGAVRADQIEGILVVRKPAALP